jgi:hypothetical protein
VFPFVDHDGAIPYRDFSRFQEATSLEFVVPVTAYTDASAHIWEVHDFPEQTKLGRIFTYTTRILPVILLDRWFGIDDVFVYILFVTARN